MDLPGVEDFILHMRVEHAFVPAELRAFFASLEVSERVIELMDEPVAPNRKVYWRDYKSRLLKPRKVVAGARFYRRHIDVLKRAEESYGVPAQIITAILGIETNYGNYLGDFSIARSLATLAFAYPRRAREFQEELAYFLIYARQSKFDPAVLRGSYAGAFGLPQFLPSSAKRFAVDFDGDGRANLFAVVDAVGSIGNFLNIHGWQKGDPIAYSVSTRGDMRPLIEATRNNDYKPLFSWEELREAGLSASSQTPAAGKYLLVDLENRYDTEYRIGTQNFYALTRYNKSFKYASAIFDMSQLILDNV